ncbi:MAG TPA: hypothetical protein VMT88_02450 [Actinomycetes bacterium]|nr:hypothetical protein [Actinomycetes bacterium]
MIKRVSALMAVLGLALGVLVAGGVAEAGIPTTKTTVTHGLVDTFTDVVPSCEGGGPRYLITTTSSSVEHLTKFGDGHRQGTFHSTGTFVAYPKNDPALPSYTGMFTSNGGFSGIGPVVTGTFTFSVSGSGSDGSSFTNQNVEHFTGMPDGSTKEFFHCH